MAPGLMDYPQLQSHAPLMANSCSLAFLIFGNSPGYYLFSITELSNKTLAQQRWEIAYYQMHYLNQYEYYRRPICLPGNWITPAHTHTGTHTQSGNRESWEYSPWPVNVSGGAGSTSQPIRFCLEGSNWAPPPEVVQPRSALNCDWSERRNS